jgi:two-component system cell cycle sensor histidine kinase/response regulator CckA
MPPELLTRRVAAGQAVGTPLYMAAVILVAGSDVRCDALQGARFSVIQATDAPTALTHAEQRPSPNLIVLDLDFPGVDAFAVCRQLKSNPDTRRIAVLVVSETVVSPEASIRALSAGADWCLAQPNITLFIESVSAMLKRRGEQARMDWLVSEEHVRQAHKMEAIGYLAFGIAHDFNNLLTAILGYSEMMLSQIGDDKPISADLHEIRKAADRAAALTGQLLRFSRKQEPSFALVDLNLVVSEAEQMLQRLIGEHIRLETRLSDDLWSIAGDATRLEQVLLNLVVNARDAIPADGGRVLIETTNTVLPSHETFPDGVTVAAGRYTRLLVQDSGIGMDEATRARLFEPYFTTKGRGHGTGLGLTTVYGIVKHYNGYIFADSTPGRGTTFRVYLPAVIEAARAPMPIARLNPFLGRETILVVEDDEAVRRYATLALRRFGYAVLEADTAERALEIAREHSEMIHLILTDVIMPGLSGPAFVHRLRESRGATPAIYMSGYPAEIIAASAVPDGNLHLSKPFATEDLLRSVRQAIDAAHGTAH